MVAQVEPATRMQLPTIKILAATTTTNQPRMQLARNQERITMCSLQEHIERDQRQREQQAKEQAE